MKRLDGRRHRERRVREVIPKRLPWATPCGVLHKTCAFILPHSRRVRVLRGGFAIFLALGRRKPRHLKSLGDRPTGSDHVVVVGVQYKGVLPWHQKLAASCGAW